MKLWQDEEYREKALSGFKEWSTNPELLKEKGKRISATINDEEHREKHLVQCLEACKKGREALKIKMQSPEYRRSDSKYVLCIETGEVFSSASQAIKVCGGKIRECIAGVRKHTKDKRTTKRLSWKVITEEEYFKLKETA